MIVNACDTPWASYTVMGELKVASAEPTAALAFRLAVTENWVLATGCSSRLVGRTILPVAPLVLRVPLTAFLKVVEKSEGLEIDQVVLVFAQQVGYEQQGAG